MISVSLETVVDEEKEEIVRKGTSTNFRTLVNSILEISFRSIKLTTCVIDQVGAVIKPFLDDHVVNVRRFIPATKVLVGEGIGFLKLVLCFHLDHLSNFVYVQQETLRTIHSISKDFV